MNHPITQDVGIFDILVTRQEDFKVVESIRVKAEFVSDNAPKNEKELLDRIREGVADWAKNTDEGKRVSRYAKGDMNFADIVDDADQIGSFMVGCSYFSLESINCSEDLDYDTKLFQEQE